MYKLNFKKRKTETWIYPIIGEKTDYIKDRKKWTSFLNNDYSNLHVATRLYIHIPYCNNICVMCPYYKEKYQDYTNDERSRFVKNIIQELKMYASTNYMYHSSVISICIGGGDPSCLSVNELKAIMSTIFDNFDMSICKTISMEGTISNYLEPEYLEQLKELGINRFNFGIQTFDKKIRKLLNLKSSCEDIYKLVEKFKYLQVEDYSADLIYNLPEQSMKVLHSDLEHFCELGATYLDIHGLDIYPNSKFQKIILSDVVNDKPSNKKEIAMYKYIMDYFERRGYNQVSSNLYSEKKERPIIGYERFLRGYPMIGIGPSARSYVECASFRNTSSIQDYNSIIEKGEFSVQYGSVVSKETDKMRKMVFFPEMTWIEKKDIPQNKKVYEIIDTLIQNNYAVWTNDILKLTKDGRCFAGNISKLFYDYEQRNKEFKNLLLFTKSS